MRLGTTLTHTWLGTAGLATIEDFNDDVPSAEYDPQVLKEFAEELEDIDGKVEVSVQNLEGGEDSLSAKALVGRVAETDDVACVAAPLVENGGDD